MEIYKLPTFICMKRSVYIHFTSERNCFYKCHCYQIVYIKQCGKKNTFRNIIFLFFFIIFLGNNVLYQSLSFKTFKERMEHQLDNFPAGIYLLQVISRKTRKNREICSKLAIKTPEPRSWRCSGVFIVNFEYVISGWIVVKTTFL